MSIGNIVARNAAQYGDREALVFGNERFHLAGTELQGQPIG